MCYLNVNESDSNLIKNNSIFLFHKPITSLELKLLKSLKRWN